MLRIVALLLLAINLLASVGKITVASGDVSVVRAGKVIKGASNTGLEEKDAITTKGASSAQIVFTDGTAVSIGANTNFRVDEYLFDEKSNKANLKVGVSEGAFKAITGKIGKMNPDKFKLETKTATIGIRGTAFLGVIPKNGPETIACTKGSIAIAPLPAIVAPMGAPVGQAPAPSGGATAPAGGGQASSAAPSPAAGTAPAPIAPSAPAPVAIEVKAGEMTTVSVGKVEAPRPFTKAEIQKLEKASSGESKKSEPAPAAGGEKKTETKQEAKVADSKVETKQDAPAPQASAPAPTPVAPIAPVLPPIADIANTVSNVQNTVSAMTNTVTNTNSNNKAKDQTNNDTQNNSDGNTQSDETPTPTETVSLLTTAKNKQDYAYIAAARLAETASTIEKASTILDALSHASGTTYTVLSNSYADLTGNALKVTYDGVTKYFKYTTNANSYGTDVVFSGLGDLTYKLNTFTGSNVVFSLDSTTFQLSFSKLASSPAFSVDKANVGSSFLGVSAYSASSVITTSTSGTDTFTSMAPMLTSFSAHKTVVLNDGRVLAVGGAIFGTWNGTSYTPNPEQQTQLYNPTASAIYGLASNSWTYGTAIPSMKEDFGAGVLPDGRVLIFGDNGTNQSWYFDPTTNSGAGSWSAAPGMLHDRLYFASATIKSGGTYSGSYGGGILAIGGMMYGSGGTQYSVEMFLNGGWVELAPMLRDRTHFAASGLLDGRVIAIGGFSTVEYNTYSNSSYYANKTEIYTPATNSWAYAASMLSPRSQMSATTLPNGHVLAIGGSSATIEEYDPVTNTWAYKVALPASYSGNGFAVTLTDGTVLLVSGSGVRSYSPSTMTFTSSGTAYSGALTTQNGMTMGDYNAGVNNGFFIGGRSDGAKVFGNINSMLFNGETSVTTAGLSVNANSGQLSGALGELSGYNTSINGFTFAHYASPATAMTNYSNEDNKLIWGGATINSKEGKIGFASLPDKVSADNVVSSVDDYSSWGYWEAVTTDSSEYYSGYWVSGQPTPAAYIQQLISANTIVNYSGHVLGDTLNGAVRDAITLDNNNKINMTINFGAANPVNVTALSFKTSQGWVYNRSSGFSQTSTMDTQSYSANITNSGDTLKINGKFYGPAANSTGGVFGGSLTGTNATQRSVYGVFKARR